MLEIARWITIADMASDQELNQDVAFRTTGNGYQAEIRPPECCRLHANGMTWKHFLHYQPIMRGIHQSSAVVVTSSSATSADKVVIITTLDVNEKKAAGEIFLHWPIIIEMDALMPWNNICKDINTILAYTPTMSDHNFFNTVRIDWDITFDILVLMVK